MRSAHLYASEPLRYSWCRPSVVVFPILLFLCDFVSMADGKIVVEVQLPGVPHKLETFAGHERVAVALSQQTTRVGLELPKPKLFEHVHTSEGDDSYKPEVIHTDGWVSKKTEIHRSTEYEKRFATPRDHYVTAHADHYGNVICKLPHELTHRESVVNVKSDETIKLEWLHPKHKLFDVKLHQHLIELQKMGEVPDDVFIRLVENALEDIKAHHRHAVKKDFISKL